MRGDHDRRRRREGGPGVGVDQGRRTQRPTRAEISTSSRTTSSSSGRPPSTSTSRPLRECERGSLLRLQLPQRRVLVRSTRSEHRAEPCRRLPREAHRQGSRDFHHEVAMDDRPIEDAFDWDGDARTRSSMPRVGRTDTCAGCTRRARLACFPRDAVCCVCAASWGVSGDVEPIQRILKDRSDVASPHNASLRSSGTGCRGQPGGPDRRRLPRLRPLSNTATLPIFTHESHRLIRAKSKAGRHR